MTIDLLLTNATFLTLDPGLPRATAVALSGEHVVWVGDIADSRYLGPVRKRVDLGGAAVVPGFNDAHHHLILLGHWLDQVDCAYPRVESISQIVEAIAARAREVPAGTWIEARGYDDYRLAEGRHPTRWDLDRATDRHPVLLHNASGHMAVVNTPALDAAAIGAGTPDPAGGRIHRDPSSGEATGLLQEQAMSLVPVPFTPQDPEVLRRCLRRGGEAYLRAGITSSQEAGIFSAPEMGAFQDAWEDGWLALRTYLMFRIPFVGAIEEMGIRSGLGDDRLRFGAVKLISDGSLIGRTAAMSEPFLADPADDNTGFLTMPREELHDVILRMHRAGWQVAIHAIGDRAIEACLDGFQRAMHADPRPDPRHRLEHCGVLRPDLIGRIRDLGVIPVSQPPFIREFGDGFLRHLGRERCRLTYPLRSLLDAGIPVAGSSDSPVSSYAPLFGIKAAVTEITADGQEFALGERLTALEALRMYTTNGAHASFDEHRKGTIEAGKLADLAVLDGDPTAISPDEIDQIGVLATMVGGRFSYERPIAAEVPA